MKTLKQVAAGLALAFGVAGAAQATCTSGCTTPTTGGTTNTINLSNAVTANPTNTATLTGGNNAATATSTLTGGNNTATLTGGNNSATTNATLTGGNNTATLTGGNSAASIGNVAGGSSTVGVGVSVNGTNTNDVTVNTAGTVGNITSQGGQGGQGGEGGKATSVSNATSGDSTSSAVTGASTSSAQTGASTSGASVGATTITSTTITKIPRQAAMAYSPNAQAGIPSADCSMTDSGYSVGVSTLVGGINGGQSGKKIWNEDSNKCADFVLKHTIAAKSGNAFNDVTGVMILGDKELVKELKSQDAQDLMGMYNNAATYTTTVVQQAPTPAATPAPQAIICEKTGKAAQKKVSATGAVVFSCDH